MTEMEEAVAKVTTEGIAFVESLKENEQLTGYEALDLMMKSARVSQAQVANIYRRELVRLKQLEWNNRQF